MKRILLLVAFLLFLALVGLSYLGAYEWALRFFSWEH
jgi:hypothetical protein